MKTDGNLVHVYVHQTHHTLTYLSHFQGKVPIVFIEIELVCRVRASLCYLIGSKDLESVLLLLWSTNGGIWNTHT